MIVLHGDESSSLTRPSSIIRRSARTRIRKANLPGDGGGHRFGSSRKGRRTTAAPDIDIPEDDWDGRKHTGNSDESADYDSQDHAPVLVDEDGNRFYDAPQHLEERRGSDSTDDMAIFDAYRQSRSSSASSENSYEDAPSNESSPPKETMGLPQIPITRPDASDWFTEEGEKTPTQERIADPFGGLRRTESGPGLSLQLPPEQQTPMAKSPTSPTTPQQRPANLPTTLLPPGMAAPRQSLKAQSSKEDLGMTPVQLDTPRPALARVESRANQEKEKEKEKERQKEKEKKGGFFSKKDKGKEKDKSKKEKDGFLGSLFGGKKKQEEVPTVTNFSSTDGRAAAAALLGTSKSAKSLGLHGLPTPGVSPTSPGFPNNYARYPIHVERAIYRLSHIKLANARRPLFEQVLISNLMFWYLGIIGRNVAEEKKPASVNGKEGKEGGEDKEQKLVAKGTPIKPADSGSAGTPLPRPPPQQPNKKMGLSKPGRSRNGRDHEAPIKAPSYGSQNAQVDHEVRTATAQVQGMSIKSRPTQNAPPPREYHPPPQQYQQQAPQQQYQQPQQPPQQQYQPNQLAPPPINQHSVSSLSRSDWLC